MKLLILDWGAYTHQDIIDTLLANHVCYKQVNYFFGDKNHDDFFFKHFTEYVLSDSFDAVFTVNYFPLIARVCHKNQIKYLCWSYDNPLNVPDIEDTLCYETNYVFLFDRIQAESYQKKGFKNIWHLPLAVNPQRLGKISLTACEYQKYHSQVSFLGKLYQSAYEDLYAATDDFHRGFLSAMCDAQSQIYGCYFIDELLTDQFMEEINHTLHTGLPDNAPIVKEQLSYAAAASITRKERLLILGLLSKHFQVKLYTTEQHPLLSKAEFCGTANYLTAMPKIFNASKINLNITLKILQSGMPLRALDIMGSGGFLLSNYQEELAENFIPDSDIAFYSDIEEAIEKTAYYLSHDSERIRIAENGKSKVFSEFNYTRQLKKLFGISGIL